MKLAVDPIPVPNGYIHPPPSHDVLPKHEFTMGIIGKLLNLVSTQRLGKDHSYSQPLAILQKLFPQYTSIQSYCSIRRKVGYSQTVASTS